jgi:6-phosphogluconolactonase
MRSYHEQIFSRASMKKLIEYLSIVLTSILLLACGGGGSSSNSPSSTQTFTIGGSVSGLSGTITLLNNAGNPLTVSSSGAFTFTSPVNQGGSYVVTVGSQPSGQSCSVSQASGTNTQSNITSVLVSCLSAGKFAYVPNFGGNNISGFSINQTTGALTAISGSPYPAGVLPYGIAVTPSGKFAYAINYNSNSISQYSINTTSGALSAIGGSEFTGPGPRVILVHPTANFVYVANQIANTVSSYSIDPVSGILTALATVPTGSQPISMAINRAGGYLYTVNIVDSTVSAFAINSTTGALTSVAGSPFSSGAGPTSIAISPSGGFAYVGGQGDIVDPATAGITSFQINPSTGALVSPLFLSSGFSASLAIDPTGQFLYSVGAGLFGYSINASTGALTELSSSPFTIGSDPISITIDPSGQFVYVPRMFDNVIAALRLNTLTGELSPIGEYGAGSGVNYITITAGSQ